MLLVLLAVVLLVSLETHAHAQGAAHPLLLLVMLLLLM